MIVIIIAIITIITAGPWRSRGIRSVRSELVGRLEQGAAVLGWVGSGPEGGATCKLARPGRRRDLQVVMVVAVVVVPVVVVVVVVVVI